MTRISGRKPLRAALRELRTSLAAAVGLAGLLGLAYPLAIWLLAQGMVPVRAGGSLVVRDGTVRGSMLVGQDFARPEYFHPRPSAAGAGYDAMNSGGSNLGPLSRRLMEEVGGRLKAYRRDNGLAPDAPVPADAVTASASGLDPHISVRNARLQAPRVARIRGLPLDEVLRLVDESTEGRGLGFLCEPGVHVLKLNLALDAAPGSVP